MLISTAFAQAGDGGGGQGGFLMSMLPLVLIFGVFWFLLIRPQQKRAKDHSALVAGAKRGDQVVTGGGLVGKVTKVLDDEFVQVEIADGIKVKVLKATLANVLNKGVPSSGGTKEGGESTESAPAKKSSLFSFGSKK